MVSGIDKRVCHGVSMNAEEVRLVEEIMRTKNIKTFSGAVRYAIYREIASIRRKEQRHEKN